LRRRIQIFIDRRLYRGKYDARKTLEAFSAQLRNETDLDALGGDLVDVVRETACPRHIVVARAGWGAGSNARKAITIERAPWQMARFLIRSCCLSTLSENISSPATRFPR
jgi:hypothetical protein